MRNSLIFIAVILFSHVGFSQSTCDDLVEGLELNILQVPSQIQAGAKMQFATELSVKNPIAVDAWEDVIINLFLTNGINGSRDLIFDITVKESGVLQALNFEWVQRIPPNFMGTYSFAATIFGLGSGFEYCGTNFSNFSSVSVDIENDPETADIMPPVVGGLETEFDSYAPGQRVVISFSATDKSEICSADKLQAGDCDPTWHVETIHEESGESFNYYNPVLARNNKLETDFYLPTELPSGTYKITKINVDDVHGNASAQLVESAQIKFNVAAQNIVRDKAKEIILPLIDSNLPPESRYMSAAVGLIKDGKSFAFGFGQISPENSETPSADNIFEIASLTKLFTSTVLAVQAAKGNLNLDDSVRQFIPVQDVPKSIALDFTLRHLATHTSGMERLPANLSPSNPLNPYEGYSSENFMEYMQTGNFLIEPIGSVWNYSNAGAGLLGNILASKLEMSFEKVVLSNVAYPLNMYDTAIELDMQQDYRFLPAYFMGNEAPHWTFGPDLVLAGAGALRSTPQDMLRFAAAQIEAKTSVLGEAIGLTQKMQSPLGQIPGSSMGLGWNRLGDQFLWHNGATYGFQSFIAIDKVNKTAVLVLTNSAIFVAGGVDERPDLAGWQLLNYLNSL